MKEIPGQISLFDIADKPLKFHEAEWLRAHGFKNVYEEPPKAGIYEFTDIEHPTKTKRLEVSENGGIMLGGLDFVARWWRPIQEESAKAAVPVCSHSGHSCNKKELWKVADTLDEIMCPHVCCRKCGTRLCGARCNGSEEPEPFMNPPKEPKAGAITMFGEEWIPLSIKPEGITQYDKLRILGPYKSTYGERWSNCPAVYKDGEIIALDVPWDIPRPDWQYWRLKEKVYPLDIKGICDDPYCPQCGYAFETTKTCKNYEVDCGSCPECHVRVDWTPWHRLNDDEPQA